MKKKALFIVGPTGSGKSALAFRIARKLQGEIISADSMQVYRGMDIGTDKPSRWARFRIPHHMLDIVAPSHAFSVYAYRTRAFLLLEKINRKGKIPVVVGGSGLYVKALVDGIAPHPGKDEAVRSQLKDEARVQGLASLYKRLEGVDPEAARRIHPHDEKRILRALEVRQISAKRLSQWEKETVPLGDFGYECSIVGIRVKREKLYETINRRVDLMFKRGLLAEARRLARKKLSVTAQQAIGYKELFVHLQGGCSLKEAKEKIQQHTRNLAKRQMIWFKRDSRIRWLDDRGDETVDAVVSMVNHA